MTGLKQYAIISASAVNQAALEDPQLGHGVLAYYFLQTLAGKYTFFLSKKIAFFKFLALVDKKVRNHRFLTDTGRKHPLKMLKENGIMVHWHDTNFHLPVLEPIPLVEDPHKNAFQQKLSQWAHFSTCTRLRTKIHLMTAILLTALLLFYLVHVSVIRIHFKPLYITTFHNSLLGAPGVYLQGIESEMLEQGYDKKISLYLFKHNWIKAFFHKLDGRGKIILKGYLLGDRFNGISEFIMMAYALGDSEGVFYWHPNDVMKLLYLIRWGYLFFDKKEKKAVLELLAKLGKNGKDTAEQVFNFKRERDQELRNLFLEHFYSIDFWKKHVHYFNRDDYITLIKNKKPAPFLKNRRLPGKLEQFLGQVARGLPGPKTRITDTNKLPEIYRDLSILAFFASPHFQRKASDLFKTAFDPDEALDLLFICQDFNDILWLLEQYFKYMQDTVIPDLHWWKLIYDFTRELPIKEKSKMIKFLFDTQSRLIPEGFWSPLSRILEDYDANIIGLNDWENWMKKYQISPYYVLHPITQMNHPRVFSFIQRYYRYFEGEFSIYMFDDLYKRDNRETVKLVKKLYSIGSSRDKLCCAIFLYSKSYQEYSSYIINFLREAGSDPHKQEILKRFYWTLTKVIIPIIAANGISKHEIRYLLTDKELFYRFVILNLRLWPEQVKRIILESKIPYEEHEGITLLRACEELPDPYRKKMLLKICKSDINDTFRLNADLSLIKHYPKEFLQLAYERKYHTHWAKNRFFVQAYQRFSFAELKQELILNLRELEGGVNINMKVNFICEALEKKAANGDVNIQDLNHIVEKFNRPVERILLRQLRHYVHKQKFLRGVQGGSFFKKRPPGRRGQSSET
jgi:hypothetical protein